MLAPTRIPLAALPTPLVRLDRLGAALDGAQIWMKRDDLTGLELSGNKVRKLEYVAAEARASGCDTLVTEGTAQSNHCRATAAVCAKLGLKCVLLLRPVLTDPPQGNFLLDRLFGAQTRHFSREEFERDRAAIVARVLDELRSGGCAPRWVPMGASEPLGCWGYIRAAAELAEQLARAGVEECDVVLAVSSGGTYAGALLGALMYKLRHWGLWAVPVSDDAEHHRREVGRLCRATIAEYTIPIDFDDGACRFIDGYVGAGYAIPTRAGIETLQLLARTEGILLDPVYTAKAFSAVLAESRAGRFGHRRPVVFIHTGGIFSDFAWPDVLLEGLPR